MKKILTINDGIVNGKGDKNIIIFDYIFYIYHIYVKNNKIFIYFNHKFIPINLSKIKIIIFNFNEDLFTYNLNWDKKLKKRFKNISDMINYFNYISFIIKKYYPKIKIYNDPMKCFLLGDKIKTYEKIVNIKNDLFKIPKWKKINSLKDIENINFFPNIIKTSTGSHSLTDSISYDKKKTY